MCGRFVSTTPLTDLAERLLVDDVRTDDDRPNWNVTPRSSIAMVAATVDPERTLERVSPERTLERVKWGLVPSWAKDLSIGDKLINARGETIRERPSYRRAFAKRRCLIPVDGFYEWKLVPGQKAKQPMYIHRPGGELIVFAGIFENWKDKAEPDSAWVRSCSIITTNANTTISAVHNRMPVILPPERHDEWLDPDNDDVESLARLLVPAPDDYLTFYPISTAVNRPSNNGPELLKPVVVEEP